MMTGTEKTIALIKGYAARMPFVGFSVDLLGIAADGALVLSERVDYVHDVDDRIVGSIRVSGAMQMTGGRIVRWRDCFDVSVAPA